MNNLVISKEVGSALAQGKPVLALESTIIAHGMPYPTNVETALRVDSIVREAGAVPAAAAILGGHITIGLSADEIDRLGRRGNKAAKASRRDIPILVAMKEDGALTVAGTMIAASLAGVQTFATGGIGGVHRGAAESFDISADLEELGRTNTAVVCAGAKSVLDIGLTLEYLETRGVPVLGYQTQRMPAFYAADSGFTVDRHINSPEEIAAVMEAKWSMGLSGGVLVVQPVPPKYALEKEQIDAVIDTALADAKRSDIRGKDITPFLLSHIAELSDGGSLKANIALMENNARLGAKIAAAHAELRHEL